MTILLRIIAVLSVSPLLCAAEETPVDTSRGDALVAEYFRLETERIERESFADINTLDDWTSRRDEYRRQLREMLGIDPLPEKTPLQPVVTGTVDHPEFTVEKLHFQSLPELYVTANLYVPKGLTGPAATVLYVCGHAKMRDGDRSIGNKTGYQHHGEWYARHGYVCLTIDSLQLGEVEGIHHGTHHLNRWWWNSRGYTPAGVEAWNCIRALDYLETRPEVDAAKIGVAGRSGGGAYSWWIAALDDRIACAVPVAGITTLRNHVVDGCVEGHCDCMYMVNTYRWDYAQVAALVAPRPLLISNTDKDRIFPLDGVVKVHEQVRRIYELYGAGDKLGLQITEGPHEDTQELHIHEFVWMNKFLKVENPPIAVPATKLFEPTQLRVFGDLPSPERNSSIDETFVPAATTPAVPQNSEEWATLRDKWLNELREKCFRAWPPDSANDVLTLGVAHVATVAEGDEQLSLYEFTSQPPYRLPLIVSHPHGSQFKRVRVIVMAQGDWGTQQARFTRAFPHAGFGEPIAPPKAFGGFGPWQELFERPLPGTVRYDEPPPGLRPRLGLRPDAIVWFPPRGIGPTEWTRDEGERTHIRRRFMLLGQTEHSARVYDVRRAIQAVRQIGGADCKVELKAEFVPAVWAVYASLFEPQLNRIEINSPPAGHRKVDEWGDPEYRSPDLLNVLRVLDMPQAVALAADHTPLMLHDVNCGDAWAFPFAVNEQLHWKNRLDAMILTVD